MIYTGYVHGGQQFSGLHRDIDIWMSSVPGAHWDKTKGSSHINGYEFYNHVNFLSEIDLVAFLIKFAGLVSRVR